MSVYQMSDELLNYCLLHMGRAENVIPTGYKSLDERIEGGFKRVIYIFWEVGRGLERLLWH